MSDKTPVDVALAQAVIDNFHAPDERHGSWWLRSGEGGRMNLHEQARAEAEKRWPVGMYHVWDGNLPISSERFGGIARDSFKDGFLAGHEAATRTRVVTTVTELDALPVGSAVLTEVGRVWQKISTAWYLAGGKRARQAEYVRLPARVLYEPEEDR